jgi:acetyl esterase/lipase
MKSLLLSALLFATIPALQAQTPTTPSSPTKPEIPKAPASAKKALLPPLRPPTMADVSYGPYQKQVLDFWKAESDKPTPLAFCIHGGGWRGGDRTAGARGVLEDMLKNGISVVSVEYRFIAEATEDGVVPPVRGCLHDAARALQFVRSKAAEWNIDKTRIGATGGSAGACSSLWLAMHDDMADPKSSDPIARESTRLLCAAVLGAQTTLDPQQMKEWTPNSVYGGHAFGFTGDVTKKITQFDEFLAKRDTILPWIAEYSPYALVSAGDPPVWLGYGAAPEIGKEQKDPTHTSNFGLKFQEQCKAMGVDCELYYAGVPNPKHLTASAYLLDKLKAK